MHTIATVLGLTNASGGWYLWWSGIFGDVTILALPVGWWFHHNCHHKGCWRIGHPHEGRVACRHHHHIVHSGTNDREAA